MKKEVKLFEVRDAATFIPVMAVRLTLEGKEECMEEWLFRTAGYNRDLPHTFMQSLNNGKGSNDPYDWDTRTMRVAHDFVDKHFDTLEEGSVIDVEHVIGDKPTPKTSQRFDSLYS